MALAAVLRAASKVLGSSARIVRASGSPIHFYSIARHLAIMKPVDYKKLSKVELHVHLDGAMRPATIFEIAQKRGIKLPVDSVEALAKACAISIDDPVDLTVFLSKFDIFMPVVAGDRDAIRRVAYEWCEDAAKENMVYSEVRYCPHLLANSLDQNAFSGAKGDITPANVVELINEGLDKGCNEFNVKVRTLLCCMRHMPSWSPSMLELCKQFKDKWVVGIDIAGDENLTAKDPTQKEHCEVFQEAAKLGIARTVHAGENGTAANVTEALDNLRAMRVGHGYHALDDDAVYQRCLKEDIHFEVCPISSFLTGSVQRDPMMHPVRKFAADKANFSINTDDPLVTDTVLTDEYNFVHSKMQLSDADILKANLNAARSCFLPADEKKELVDRLTKEYETEYDVKVADL